MQRRERGIRGEDAAAAWMRKQGWRLLQRNIRSKLGEIDLIARDGQTLVFAEVKARQSGSLAPPQAAVTTAKQRRIGRLAQAYLQRNKLRDVACRFDVMAVELDARGEVLGIEHLPNAFDLLIL